MTQPNRDKNHAEVIDCEEETQYRPRLADRASNALMTKKTKRTREQTNN